MKTSLKSVSLGVCVSVIGLVCSAPARAGLFSRVVELYRKEQAAIKTGRFRKVEAKWKRLKQKSVEELSEAAGKVEQEIRLVQSIDDPVSRKHFSRKLARKLVKGPAIEYNIAIDVISSWMSESAESAESLRELAKAMVDEWEQNRVKMAGKKALVVVGTIVVASVAGGFAGSGIANWLTAGMGTGGFAKAIGIMISVVGIANVVISYPVLRGYFYKHFRRNAKMILDRDYARKIAAMLESGEDKAQAAPAAVGGIDSSDLVVAP